MHWLNFPSFNFGFHSQLRCYSCHASHGNFRCVAINWIYSQKSAAFENPQKRNGVTRSEKFSGSKIEPFPHLLLWRWQLQNHLILILPNNTGTPTQKRTPKYSSRIHIPFLHTKTNCSPYIVEQWTQKRKPNWRYNFAIFGSYRNFGLVKSILSYLYHNRKKQV